MSLLDALQTVEAKPSLIMGAVVGVVTNNQDPDELGRVKVKIPSISSDEESAWARVTSPMAGSDRGLFYLPEVDDEVLLAFEYGDISRPFVIGSLWNGVDKPPEKNSDGKNNIRMIKSRSGHVISLNDEDGKEKIEIIDKSGENSISIDTEKNTITITAKDEIKIVTADGKISIEAKEAKLTVKEKLEIKAKELKIETDSNIEIKSGADLKLEASGNLDAKGSAINLN